MINILLIPIFYVVMVLISFVIFFYTTNPISNKEYLIVGGVSVLWVITLPIWCACYFFYKFFTWFGAKLSKKKKDKK